MDFETQAYNQIKKYLESLGYPDSSIFLEYNIRNSKIDAVVKAIDQTLIAIEIKKSFSISSDEISYHPITRNLQKAANHLGAKYYILSDGKQNIWLKTGQNGRPEKTGEILYSNFNADTLSEFEFTNELLIHIAEFVRNYPITGDHLYDLSLVIYAKLIQEINDRDLFSIDLQDIIGTYHIQEKSPRRYSSDEILKEALQRLQDVNLLDNRTAVFEFIDAFFNTSRKEWNVPRWMADFMVSFISENKKANVLDLFSRNGTLTSAAYLRGYENVHSYYTSHKELYWIKIQQILGNHKESEIKFEPGILKGDFEVLPMGRMDTVLLAPPFNLKFHFTNSYLGRQGIKDGNTLFLEAALSLASHDGKVIALIPDGFLLSKQYEKARTYFQSKIRAVISLPAGAFKPYSAVKSSLIILTKNARKKQENVFMAFLESIPEHNSLYKEYDNALKSILNNFDLFKNEKEIHPSENGFIVEELNVENLHVSKYWLDKYSKSSDTIEPVFFILPLKEVVKIISRGSSIVKDPNGEIACINPGTIREFQLKREYLSYTSEKKLPKGKIQRAAADDVLVNIIGSYRGKAALVSKEFEGMLINRHVAILKPDTSLILPGYLTVVLNSKFVQEQFYDQTSGTVIPALNLSSFEEITLLVPDLKTQEQIYLEYAKRLDELEVINTRAKILEGEINQKLFNLGKEDKL